MTDSERLRVGIALSLFAHFLLLNEHWQVITPIPPLTISVSLELESSAVTAAQGPGFGINNPSPEAQEQNRIANMKRKAFLQFLTEVETAIHTRRFERGTADLIGLAQCTFIIQPDGHFAAIDLQKSSGNPQLDAAALYAVGAASGVVKRPKIIGPDAIPMTVQVKYQYGLH